MEAWSIEMSDLGQEEYPVGEPGFQPLVPHTVPEQSGDVMRDRAVDRGPMKV